MGKYWILSSNLDKIRQLFAHIHILLHTLQYAFTTMHFAEPSPVTNSEVYQLCTSTVLKPKQELQRCRRPKPFNMTIMTTNDCPSWPSSGLHKINKVSLNAHKTKKNIFFYWFSLHFLSSGPKSYFFLPLRHQNLIKYHWSWKDHLGLSGVHNPYGTEGGGLGQKSKYTVLPRVCLV